ncbi:uncharacterized protein B0H18DRAFT_953634 [Fomitopsis serialis]|uniref:uncharacterized protein n=1 Tax=Fomitopsis serialis TaxID=139415 RepID=UPI002007A672|nr:uncharacterized protein B0H18DRAFT_953634 [Neoantrodia serialis]KAH9929480.1 hypothetical protein B0H18DRAFT_953634 [Neoantrodia serialis]
MRQTGRAAVTIPDEAGEAASNRRRKPGTAMHTHRRGNQGKCLPCGADETLHELIRPDGAISDYFPAKMLAMACSKPHTPGYAREDRTHSPSANTPPGEQMARHAAVCAHEVSLRVLHAAPETWPLRARRPLRNAEEVPAKRSTAVARRKRTSDQTTTAIRTSAPAASQTSGILKLVANTHAQPDSGEGDSSSPLNCEASAAVLELAVGLPKRAVNGGRTLTNGLWNIWLQKHLHISVKPERRFTGRRAAVGTTTAPQPPPQRQLSRSNQAQTGLETSFLTHCTSEALEDDKTRRPRSEAMPELGRGAARPLKTCCSAGHPHLHL